MLLACVPRALGNATSASAAAHAGSALYSTFRPPTLTLFRPTRALWHYLELANQFQLRRTMAEVLSVFAVGRRLDIEEVRSFSAASQRYLRECLVCS